MERVPPGTMKMQLRILHSVQDDRDEGLTELFSGRFIDRNVFVFLVPSVRWSVVPPLYADNEESCQ